MDTNSEFSYRTVRFETVLLSDIWQADGRAFEHDDAEMAAAITAYCNTLDWEIIEHHRMAFVRFAVYETEPVDEWDRYWFERPAAGRKAVPSAPLYYC